MSPHGTSKDKVKSKDYLLTIIFAVLPFWLAISWMKRQYAGWKNTTYVIWSHICTYVTLKEKKHCRKGNTRETCYSYNEIILTLVSLVNSGTSYWEIIYWEILFLKVTLKTTKCFPLNKRIMIALHRLFPVVRPVSEFVLVQDVATWHQKGTN